MGQEIIYVRPQGGTKEQSEVMRRLNVESEAPHWVSSISVDRTDEDTARRIGTEANYWES